MSKRNGGTNEDKATTISRATVEWDAGNKTYQYLSRNDYTIGWICALPKELTAATAMLDHIHPDLPKPPNDPNTYTLGSIGKHKIVIACLPKGKIGTNSAAIFVTQMVRSFPSIKVGLMVGIGGGIPSKVRLGDVVISTPVDQYQGVVQWDFGKTEIGRVFRRTGGLNSPPSALSTALTKMETRSRLHGYKIHQYLEDMGQKWRSLVPEYTRPPPPKGLRVVPGSPFAWRAIGIMLGKVILALFWNLLGFWIFYSKFSGPEQVETNKNPREPGDSSVHYGLIASSNQVIKDAEFRDRLNESLDGNVLCIEIEAAGLMNDFPCIVIRGICDYADSEKSKDWQEYAATVAAACAKELLQYVQPSDVDGERLALDILNRS